MKKIETEVLVIGAGLAGVAAALSAAKAGKKVLVIGRESGASAMNSGAIDVASDPLALPGRPQRWNADAAKNIEELLLRTPDHPYGLISQSAEKILARVKDAVELVFPSSEGFLSGSEKTCRLVFNQIGTFKQTSFTQSHMLGVSEIKNARSLLLLGFSGLGDFDPGFFAKNLSHWAKELGANAKLAIAEIETDGLSGKSSLEVSRWLLENLGPVTQEIGKAIKTHNPAVVVLPAVIPGEVRKEFLDRLENIYAIEAREPLSLPPSVPGKRLAQYLENRLKSQGAERLIAKAAGFEQGSGGIQSVTAETAGEKMQIFAKSFVLASGSFLAGGIAKHDSFRETIFGLDVFSNNGVPGGIFTEKLTCNKVRGPHPLFSVGLKADRDFRILDRQGKVAYQNLFAAGAILCGANYIFDGTAGGTALATGLAAGQNTANY